MAAPRTCSFVIPGDWLTPTGGYRYDRRIVLALRAAGWQVARCTLEANFPWPDAAALAEAEQRLAALPDGTLAVADGLAFGAMPDLVHRHAARLRWVALLHHPLYLETGLDDAARATLLATERRALQAARRVIVTSAATARDLAPLAVPAERIAVVEPGTDPAPAARSNDCAAPGAVRLLCVAALVPRKGHAVLLQALGGLLQFDWTLHCIGSAQRDPATAAELHRASTALGLADRVHWHGELDDERARRSLRRRRSLRAGLASRGLRHGGRRGAGARPAGGRDHGRRAGADAAPGGRPAGTARRCGRAARSAGASDRRCRPACAMRRQRPHSGLSPADLDPGRRAVCGSARSGRVMALRHPSRAHARTPSASWRLPISNELQPPERSDLSSRRGCHCRAARRWLVNAWRSVRASDKR
jgi:hypothetical protein